MVKIIFKTLLTAMLPVMVIAKSLSNYIGLSYLTCFIPLLPVLSIGVIYIIKKCSYRPAENHLGVIYRFERFHHFVNPDEWTLILPYFENVHREVGLYTRTTEAKLDRVELQDGLTVEARFKIFFKIDLRVTYRENLLQALKFEGPEWPEMIKTSMEDIARNQIFLNIDHLKMNTFRKSREIKRLLSKEISTRMKGFGILINEENGVMLVDARPNETYFEAVQKYKAATPMGQAALERLQPILDTLKHMRHEDARAALLLEMASKIIEVENLPNLFLSPAEDYMESTTRTKENRRNTDYILQQKRNSVRDFPLAT